MNTKAGHTLQWGHKTERSPATGLFTTRLTLECSCGTVFANLLVTETGAWPIEAYEAFNAAWKTAKEHLQEMALAVAAKRPQSVPDSAIRTPQSALDNPS